MVSFNSRARPVQWAMSDLSGPYEPFIIKSTAYLKDLTRESYIYWL